MKTVGIIGFGSFGQFLAEKLSPYAKVVVSSSRPDAVPPELRSTFDEVAKCDYIIPAIPLSTYIAVLTRLKPLINEETIIIDVCSVKVLPIRIIQEILPNTKVVATHPLFGPESAQHSLDGHTFVLCRDVSDQTEASKISEFARSLGLQVIEMSADNHDKEMAFAHGLTFFIAQALVDLGLHEVTLQTPSFLKLLDLANLERHHSEDLFQTIQVGNPYTKAIRQKFVDEATRLNQSLK